MESYKKLMLANRAWAKEKLELRPDFFETLAEGQKPELLWIGCSDSRVPAEEITGTQPGELFVHRNIANLYIHADFNLLSVLEYAVLHLRVKHIIVCGHYGCGGVAAALSAKDYGVLNKWLFYIKETHHKYQDELGLLTGEKKLERMVELNVREQVLNLAKTALVQNLWKSEQRPLLHGWVFGLKDGLLREQVTLGPDTPLDPIFRFE